MSHICKEFMNTYRMYTNLKMFGELLIYSDERWTLSMLENLLHLTFDALTPLLFGKFPIPILISIYTSDLQYFFFHIKLKYIDLILFVLKILKKILPN